MADATLYRSTDSGAPSPVGGSGLAIERFYQFIVPCLVTGYGSGLTAKPGQGWEVFHVDLPNGFILKAPDNVYYIFWKTPSTLATYGFYAGMAESINTPVTYPPTGVNVRSSHWSADYNAAYGSRHFVSFGTSADPLQYWAVAARGAQVFITTCSISSESGSGQNPTIAEKRGSLNFLGSPKMKDPTAPKSGPQTSCLLGGGVYALGSATTGTANSGYMDGPCTRLRDPLSGAIETAILTSVVANPYYWYNQTYSRAEIDPLPLDLTLTAVEVWLSGTGAYAYLPGVFFSGRFSYNSPAAAMVYLGRGSTYGATDAPFVIDGEEFYYIPNATGGLFISLLEKYW